MAMSPQTKQILKDKYKTCRLCRTKENLQFHHILPGINHVNNMLPLCGACHRKYHDVWDNIVKERVAKGIAAFKKDVSKKYVDEDTKPLPVKQITNREQILSNKFADLKKELIVRQNNFEKKIMECIKK